MEHPQLNTLDIEFIASLKDQYKEATERIQLLRSAITNLISTFIEEKRYDMVIQTLEEIHIEIDSNLGWELCQTGNLSILKFLHGRGYDFFDGGSPVLPRLTMENIDWIINIERYCLSLFIRGAALQSNMEVLKYILDTYENKVRHLTLEEWKFSECDPEIIELLREYDLDIEFIDSLGKQYKEAMEKTELLHSAIINLISTFIEEKRYDMIVKTLESTRVIIDSNFGWKLGQTGHLPILKFLHTYGYNLFKRGSSFLPRLTMENIDWIIDNDPDANCALSIRGAALQSNIEVLRYILETKLDFDFPVFLELEFSECTPEIVQLIKDHNLIFTNNFSNIPDFNILGVQPN